MSRYYTLPAPCFFLQRYTNHLLHVFLFLMLSTALPAQFRTGQRFSASLIAGLTASQIDGDVSAGYHKVGLQGGLNVMAKLKGKQAASIEMLFTQRGCRNQPTFPPYYNTTLNYVEVPVQWHYFDWAVSGSGNEPDWYRAQANLGLTYGRLISARDKYEDGYGITSAIPDLNRNSICAAVGGSIFITRRLGLTFRYHRALHFLYRPGDGKNYPNNLYEHFIAFQMNYRI